MPSDARLTNAVPGPRPYEGAKTGKLKLPAPLAEGVLPDENSRMWLFVPKSVQQGDGFIQDDTRDWFRDRNSKIVICREYPDHPRWLPLRENSMRAMMHNAQIISEVHMLARLAAGRPEYPAWVPARMTVKQQQADLSFRLTKAARETFIKAGPDAMETFASKAPGQFIKWLGATFVPKKIESDVTVRPGEVIDPETADQILAALNEELKRRMDEAKVVSRTHVLDYDAPGDVVEGVVKAAETFRAATETKPSERVGSLRFPAHRDNLERPDEVIDLEADVPNETEWD